MNRAGLARDLESSHNEYLSPIIIAILLGTI